MKTPGHTPGSGMYILRDKIFAGDTVFSGGGYGRFDLPGGDYGALLRSIELVMTLDGGLSLYPGHGSSCTVSEFIKDYRR